MSSQLPLGITFAGAVLLASAAALGTGPSARSGVASLSTVTLGSGAQAVLWPRADSPTLALCVDYATRPARETDPPLSVDALEARGVRVDVEQLDDGERRCAELPSAERGLAVWLVRHWLGTVARAPRRAASDEARALAAARLRAEAEGPVVTTAARAIALVGELDPDSLILGLRRLALPAAPTRSATTPAVEGTHELRLASAEPFTVIAWAAPPRGQPERAALELGAARLARALPSRGAPLTLELSGATSVALLWPNGPPDVGPALGAATTRRPAGVEERRLAQLSFRRELASHRGAARLLLDGIATSGNARSALGHEEWLARATPEAIAAATRRLASNGRVIVRVEPAPP